MLGIILKMFIRLLTSLVSASNYTKCIFLSNQKCEIQLTFINFNCPVKNFTTIHLQLN